MVRLGFGWGHVFYYVYSKERPHSIGNYLGPYIGRFNSRREALFNTAASTIRVGLGGGGEI